ncbi:MAG: CoA-binding protein [Acidimicrobiia bacterium]|nr:CoA-binding protein [Acidimicrobiia bacterium]
MGFDLDNVETSIAVVGATDDLSKYGARIYRDLKAKGYRVFAVNPARDTVDGDPAYNSLADIGEAPSIVDIVVPPRVTLSVLRECAELGLRNVWVQPGAENEEVLAALRDGDFDYHAGGPCIMVETRAVS